MEYGATTKRGRSQKKVGANKSVECELAEFIVFEKSFLFVKRTLCLTFPPRAATEEPWADFPQQQRLPNASPVT